MFLNEGQHCLELPKLLELLEAAAQLGADALELAYLLGDG